MSKNKTTDDTTETVEYRVFNLPGHGRVRAPVSMTVESLMEAMRKEDPEAAPK